MPEGSAKAGQLPIVFLGPSMPLGEASAIVEADFRPPCARGDFGKVPDGAIVGLVDGVFDQSDAVSPREIVHALQRGVVVLGSSSMGALRAAEIPGIVGIGRIYEMYRLGIIEEDEEVALVFNPETFFPYTVPLVNVRYAIERLQMSGTVSTKVASQVLEAARTLPYSQRTYEHILAGAGLNGKFDADDLLNLLRASDLKRDDTRLLLERVADLSRTRKFVTPSPHTATKSADYGEVGSFSTRTADPTIGVGHPVYIWETGDRVDFHQLILFLKLTGNFEQYATNAVTIMLANQRTGAGRTCPLHTKQDFRNLASAWGWRTIQEERVSLHDLGLRRKDVLEDLLGRRYLQDMYSTCARNCPDAFLKALKSELLANDMALKREAMRCGTVLTFGGAPEQAERGINDTAVGVMCRLHRINNPKHMHRRLRDVGVDATEAQTFVSRLQKLCSLAKTVVAPVSTENVDAGDHAFGLEHSQKAPGTDRFAISIADAFTHCLNLQRSVGVTRVGMIAKLAELNGVYVAQAARPDGAWSSSYGSGKSDSKEGAIVGAVMEEVEKWAQERFTGCPVECSYTELDRQSAPVIDPRSLDLPHDSNFDTERVLPWHQCADLIKGSVVWVPLAAIACPFQARKNNPYYSARGGRVVFSTNGLASGFTLAEAMLHAVCECIERHATRICDLRMENPGLKERSSWPRQISLQTLPALQQTLIQTLAKSGCDISLWDITSGIRVPTLTARLIRDSRLAQGWAAHPNPAVAAHMALLEACQTLASQIAAGREDLSVQARSLGRHERTRPMRRSAESFWLNPNSPPSDLAQVQGFLASDIYDEFVWVRSQLGRAGVAHVFGVNLTRPEIAPAQVVRVIIPGLETTNPFYCGPRARMALITDLLALDPEMAGLEFKL